MLLLIHSLPLMLARHHSLGVHPRLPRHLQGKPENWKVYERVDGVRLGSQSSTVTSAPFLCVCVWVGCGALAGIHKTGTGGNIWRHFNNHSVLEGHGECTDAHYAVLLQLYTHPLPYICDSLQIILLYTPNSVSICGHWCPRLRPLCSMLDWNSVTLVDLELIRRLFCHSTLSLGKDATICFTIGHCPPGHHPQMKS